MIAVMIFIMIVVVAILSQSPFSSGEVFHFGLHLSKGLDKFCQYAVSIPF